MTLYFKEWIPLRSKACLCVACMQRNSLVGGMNIKRCAEHTLYKAPSCLGTVHVAVYTRQVVTRGANKEQQNIIEFEGFDERHAHTPLTSSLHS